MKPITAFLATLAITVGAIYAFRGLAGQERKEGHLLTPQEELDQAAKGVIDAQLKSSKRVNTRIQILRELAALKLITGKWPASEEDVFAKKASIRVKHAVADGIAYAEVGPTEVTAKKVGERDGQAKYEVSAFGTTFEDTAWISKDYD